MPFDYVSQPKVKVDWCNLCGTNRFAQVTNVDRYGLPVTVVKCLGCKLKFINPRMTDEAYAQFYRDGHYRRLLSKHTGGDFDIGFIEKGQKGYAKKVSAMLEGHLYGYEEILDVGGSTGVVSERLVRDYHVEPTILDPSEEEIESARGRGMKAICGTLEDVFGIFDAVLLCQTIEHLTDIMGSLRKIHSLLRNGGLLFVDVARNSEYKVDHCYYPNRKTSRQYLNKAGFGIRWESKDSVMIHPKTGKLGATSSNIRKFSLIAVKP